MFMLSDSLLVLMRHSDIWKKREKVKHEIETNLTLIIIPIFVNIFVCT